MKKNKENEFIKGGYPLIIPINKNDEDSELKERHFANKHIVDVNTIINIKKGSPLVDFVIESSKKKKSINRNKKKDNKKEITQKNNVQKIDKPDESLQDVNILDFIGDLNIVPIKRQIKRQSKKKI